MKRTIESGRENEGNSQMTSRIPAWKHILDLLFVLLTMPAWLPVMCVIAFGIKIVSRGPLFFCQERIGFRNKPFTCLKFRTMKVDADTQVHSDHMNDLISRDVPMIKMNLPAYPRLILFVSILLSTL